MNIINPEFDYDKIAAVDWDKAIQRNYRVALFTLFFMLAIPAEA